MPGRSRTDDVIFLDRREAGRRLAAALDAAGLGLREPIVLALPRGGVPVAFEVARRLGAPLDVLVARKLGAPGHPELGIGAIAERATADVVVVDERAVRALRVPADGLDALVASEREELRRRVVRYRGTRPLPHLVGRDVVLVDDGLATGGTATAALRSVRALGAARAVLAVPVCAPGTATRLRSEGHELVCVAAPARFRAVGQWYEDFAPTTDGEVVELLARSAGSGGAIGEGGP